MVAGLLLSDAAFGRGATVRHDHVLTTAPIRDRDIVLGKFVSSFGVLTLMNLLTAYMPLRVYIRGKVSVGHILVGYLGMILLGAAVTAIGLFASSLARSQVVAVIIGAAMVASMILLWVVARAGQPAVQYFLLGARVAPRKLSPVHGRHALVRSRRVLSDGHVLFLALGHQGAGGPSMALNEASEKSVDSGRAAPGWVFPLYAGGMGLVFLGERVLSGLEKGRRCRDGPGRAVRRRRHGAALFAALQDRR